MSMKSDQDVVHVMNSEGAEQNGSELQLDEKQQEILMFVRRFNQSTFNDEKLRNCSNCTKRMEV